MADVKSMAGELEIISLSRVLRRTIVVLDAAFHVVSTYNTQATSGHAETPVLNSLGVADSTVLL